MSVIESESEIIIDCSDCLSVSLVADFKPILSQAASQNLPIILDASELERIDAAAVQLISAFFIEAKESGLDISWRNPTESLRYASELIGLKDVLHL